MQAGPSLSTAEVAQPTLPKRPPPGLTSLPLKVLSLICHYADHTIGRDDQWYVRGPTFKALRLCCKQLSLVLAKRIAPFFEVVSIKVCNAGLDFLHRLASGPFAKDIKHIVVAPLSRRQGFEGSSTEQLQHEEQMTLLGLGRTSTSVSGDPSVGREDVLETLLAARLANTFGSLPALQRATIGTGRLYGGPYHMKASPRVLTPTLRHPSFKDPYPPSPMSNKAKLVSSNLPEDDDYESRVITKIFRGLLLSLAHARETAWYRIIAVKVNIGFLDETAYSFTERQRDLMKLMLAELRALPTRPGHSKDNDEFKTFMNMCPHLRYRRLVGYLAPADFILLDESERLQLETLELYNCTIQPTTLIKLLSHWSPKTVLLKGVCLHKDIALVRDHRKKFWKLAGYPVLWHAVLCAVSDLDQEERTEKLVLDGIKEVCSFDDKTRTVKFRQDRGDEPQRITVKADTLEVAFVGRYTLVVNDRPNYIDSKGTTLMGKSGDVFYRAAGMLKTPLDAFPAPPEQPTVKPQLALLPFEVLSFVCKHLKLKDITNLRRSCKALANVLFETVGKAFGTVPVPIMASPTGVAELLRMASSPFGPYIQHVVISRMIGTTSRPKRKDGTLEEVLVAQLAFLGIDSDSVDPSPPATTPFAQALEPVLGALPALQMITVGSLPIYNIDSHRRVEPLGTKTYKTRTDKRAVNAVFRGVLFALANAHAKGRTISSLEVYGYPDWCGHCGLDDSAFSLTPPERDLVTPFLSSLLVLGLALDPYDHDWQQSWDNFHAFLRLCSGVTKLSLDGVVYKVDHDSASSFALQKLVEEPFPLPRLVVLKLERFALKPLSITKLLSQWPARQVTLSDITLQPQSKARNPQWDEVFVAVTGLGTSMTQRLELENLYLTRVDDTEPYQADDGGGMTLTQDSERSVFSRAAERLKSPEPMSDWPERAEKDFSDWDDPRESCDGYDDDDSDEEEEGEDG